MTHAAKSLKSFGRRCIYKKIHDLTCWVKVRRIVALYHLHHVAYAATKFEVASSNGLGGDIFTRNVTDGRIDARADGRRTDFGTKIIYRFF